jgi:hypothetical protein
LAKRSESIQHCFECLQPACPLLTGENNIPAKASTWLV